MRRHLIVVMVGIVAGALLLAGLGTFLLAGRGVRANDVTDVVHQAGQVVAGVQAPPVVVGVVVAGEVDVSGFEWG